MKTMHLQKNKICTMKNEIFEVVLICMIGGLQIPGKNSSKLCPKWKKPFF